MKIIDKFLNKRIIRLLRSKNFSFTGNAIQDAFPQFFSQEREAYNSFVYSCVNVRSEKISVAKLSIFDGDREIENPNDVVMRLFTKPNPQKFSFDKILYLITACLDIYGEAYVLIVRNGLLVPDFFQLILPTAVTKITDATNSITLEYEINTTTGVKTIPLNDMLYFSLCNMKDLNEVKATVDALSDVIEINSLRTSFQKNLFKNNARIDGVLQSDINLGDEEFNRLRKSWEVNYSGTANSGKALILEGGLKFTPTQSTAKEMDYVNSINAIRDEIISVFRVPKFLLGISESGDSRSNALNQMRSFMENVIIPFSKLNIFSVFDVFLKENFRESLELIPDYTLEQDPELTKAEIQMLLENNVISRNEARGVYEWDRIEMPDFDDPNQNKSNKLNLVQNE